jgi:hypothetical protein
MSATTAPLPRQRRTPRWLRITLVVIVAVIAVATIGNGAWTLLALSARHTFETTSAYGGIRTLTVENNAGDVDLVSAPAGAPVRVVAKITRGLDQPHRAAVREAGGGLRLTASCPSDFNDVSCNVDYRVAVPQGTRLVVQSSAGDVALHDYTTHGPLNVSSSAGDVSATRVTAASVRLHSSAGDVRGSALTAPVVHGDSSAGDVHLDLLTAPRSLTATSSAGDVRLTVPNAVYAVTASSSAGAVTDDGVRRDPRSPRKITAKSSAGDVSIDIGRPHP